MISPVARLSPDIAEPAALSDYDLRTATKEMKRSQTHVNLKG
jgi:hypothetical protein